MNFSLPKVLQKKKEVKKFFLTVILKPYQVHVVLSEEVAFKFVVRHTADKKLDVHINDLSQEELIQIGDEIISPFEEYVSSPQDLDKTVFSVPIDWVEHAKIKKEKLSVLKKFCESLSLTPIGFIVNPEAVVSKLHAIEGVPLSGIIIDVNEKSLLLYIVKNNEIVSSSENEIEEDLIHTIEKTLRQSDLEVLPNRIILLESDEIEDIKNSLLSHTWTKDLPFLQIPNVSIFKKGLEFEAIIEGVGSQLRLDVEYSKGSKEDGHVKKEELHIAEMEDFGFEKERDVEKEEEAIPEESNIIAVSEVSDFTNDEEQNEHKTERPQTKKMMIPSVGIPNVSFSSLPKIAKVFKEFSARPGLIMIPLALILIGGGGVFGYLRFVSSAKVVIFTDAEKVSVDTDIVLSSENDPSIEKPILPLGVLTQKVQGEASKETTGEKETGEKAKGEVTVFNKTEKSVSFDKGEVLVSQNDLQFLLADDLSIASTSAFSTEFSNKKVSVEAKSFGKEYNLPKDTNFTFDDYPSSSFFAKNSEAFSGGTKKVSQIVAQDDIDGLEGELIDSLKRDALDEVQKQLDQDQTLLPDPLSSDLSNVTFSKKKGEEAKEISASGDVVFEFGVYNKNDVEKLARGLSEKSIPPSFQFNRDQSKIELKDLLTDDTPMSARLIADAIYSPKIDKETLRADLSGKMTSQAIKNIKKIDGVREVTILPGMEIPLLSSFLPLNPNRIDIEIKTEL